MSAFIKAMGLMIFLPALANACELKPLHVMGSRVHEGSLSMQLGAADDPGHPSAWEGPLQIVMAGHPACTVSDEVAIIEGPLLLGDARILFVPTYSGSANRLYAVDVESCRILWRSKEFSGATRHAGNALVVAGQSLKLSSTCMP